jgi:hypothetical protein
MVRCGHTGLTDDQKTAVEQLGFVWSFNEAAAWENIDLMRQFKRDYGHCRAKTRFVDPGGSHLGVWVKAVREWFSRTSSRGTSLTDDQMAALDMLGFEWNCVEADTWIFIEALQAYARDQVKSLMANPQLSAMHERGCGPQAKAPTRCGSSVRYSSTRAVTCRWTTSPSRVLNLASGSRRRAATARRP